ncbi:AI-2E family transporter [Afifella pfennigii]|uniref:AI-2E family transporter n=1 Tax=Afifella pfennigii TaxID=209897 RepID=UPI00055720F3|nr:AI-2E family transporter [Afifella pfennigii]
MKNLPFLNLVLAVVLVATLGWLLVVGRPILLPIVTAVISVYVMVSATEFMRRLPVLSRLPTSLLRLLVLLGFTVVIIAFAIVIASTAQEIAVVAPTYQTNLDMLVANIASRFDLETQEIWDEIRKVTVDRIDLQRLALAILGGFTSIGASVFLVIVYAAFLMSERGAFAKKVAAAVANEDLAKRTLQILTDINRRISDYLAVKTTINIILGILSYAILWIAGVDFAAFWAITIAVLNYIPYVGSYLGVAFPVILSLAQFGSLTATLVLLVFLTGAQILVGNFIEPRLIGRQLNLSPFAVLVALSLWGAMWGIPGAILAIPLTSIVVIVLSSFEQTRFLAVLIAERVEAGEPTRRQEAGGA